MKLNNRLSSLFLPSNSIFHSLLLISQFKYLQEHVIWQFSTIHSELLTTGTSGSVQPPLLGSCVIYWSYRTSFLALYICGFAGFTRTYIAWRWHGNPCRAWGWQWFNHSCRRAALMFIWANDRQTILRIEKAVASSKAIVLFCSDPTSEICCSKFYSSNHHIAWYYSFPLSIYTFNFVVWVYHKNSNDWGMQLHLMLYLVKWTTQEWHEEHGLVTEWNSPGGMEGSYTNTYKI